MGICHNTLVPILVLTQALPINPKFLMLPINGHDHSTFHPSHDPTVQVHPLGLTEPQI